MGLMAEPGKHRRPDLCGGSPSSTPTSVRLDSGGQSPAGRSTGRRNPASTTDDGIGGGARQAPSAGPAQRQPLTASTASRDPNGVATMKSFCSNASSLRGGLQLGVIAAWRVGVVACGQKRNAKWQVTRNG
ncbi:unnamed protein product [Urochloa humidicola]